MISLLGHPHLIFGNSSTVGRTLHSSAVSWVPYRTRLLFPEHDGQNAAMFALSGMCYEAVSGGTSPAGKGLKMVR